MCEVHVAKGLNGQNLFYRPNPCKWLKTKDFLTPKIKCLPMSGVFGTITTLDDNKKSNDPDRDGHRPAAAVKKTIY